MKITKITTWGGGQSSGYIKVYNLQFTHSADVNTWLNYGEGGKIRVNILNLFGVTLCNAQENSMIIDVIELAQGPYWENIGRVPFVYGPSLKAVFDTNACPIARGK